MPGNGIWTLVYWGRSHVSCRVQQPGTSTSRQPSATGGVVGVRVSWKLHAPSRETKSRCGTACIGSRPSATNSGLVQGWVTASIVASDAAGRRLVSGSLEPAHTGRGTDGVHRRGEARSVRILAGDGALEGGHGVLVDQVDRAAP